MTSEQSRAPRRALGVPGRPRPEEWLEPAYGGDAWPPPEETEPDAPSAGTVPVAPLDETSEPEPLPDPAPLPPPEPEPAPEPEREPEDRPAEAADTPSAKTEAPGARTGAGARTE